MHRHTMLLKSVSKVVILCGNIVQVLYHDDGSVKGIATNDVGIAKDGSPKVSSSCCINPYI